MKSPEQFDFSKPKDQKKFEKLSEKKKDIIVDESMEEASLMQERVASGHAEDYDEAFEMMEKEIEGNKWKTIYDDCIKTKSKKAPLEFKNLLGGSLESGSVSLESIDIKQNISAAILEEHHSEEDAGIRYSTKVVLSKDGKVFYDSEFETVRGAYRDEKDNLEEWWNEIKILDIGKNEVTIGRASNDSMLIEKVVFPKKNESEGWNEEIIKVDFKEQRKQVEERKLKKELDESKDFNTFVAKLEEILGKKHRRVSMKKLREDLALIIGKDSENSYDPVISDITFYLLKKGWKEPKKIHKDPGVDTYDRPKNTVTGADIDLGEVKEANGKIIIPVKMEIFRSGWRGDSYVVRKENFEIKFEDKNTNN